MGDLLNSLILGLYASFGGGAAWLLVFVGVELRADLHELPLEVLGALLEFPTDKRSYDFLSLVVTSENESADDARDELGVFATLLLQEDACEELGGFEELLVEPVLSDVLLLNGFFEE